MPTISNKANKMPESPIRKLVPYAEKAIASGKTVYHLNIGQPDIRTPEIALKAVKENNIEVLAYSHSAGFESYRKKLITYYNSKQIYLDINDLIVTTGGSEAILFALNSIADFGDEVIIPEPFYANYNGFCASAGVNVVPIASSIENGFSLPPIQSFQEKITPKTKAIIICNPNNPTGYLYSDTELQQLKELVLQNDLFLIADEVYREFIYDGTTHQSVLNLTGLDQHAVVIDSVSKRFSMCGARIGCLITKNKELMQSALKFAQARLSPPTYAQIAAEAALGVDASYFEQVNTEYQKRRNLLVDGLNSIDGVFCPKPKGAFYCMAKLPVKNTEHFAKWLLESFDWNGKTVMLAPANGFYGTKGLGLNQVRVAYVLKEEELKESVEILREALKQYPN